MAEEGSAGEQYSDHSLHLDTSALEQTKSEQVDDDFSPSPPSSSVAQSPLTPGIPGSNSVSSEGRDIEPSKEPTSGPQRLRSTGGAGGKGEREKRKRSRVTPEQLVHLERFFTMDRSPTAARRKEISDMLGMQERQTQIWFQNRRAKAKLQDGKKGRDGTAESPPDTPPELATGYEADLHSLLHEDEPVTIIPCTDLSVGTWRRIATTVGKHDLVAYLCDTKRCLTWFIHSSGYGFKMEIPFDIIVDTEFTNAAPGSGLASFILSQPPTFYLESCSPPGRGAELVRHWKKCADWTEGQQATKVLRHDLVGSAVQLAHVLRHLNAHTSGSDIRLHSPGYFSNEPSPALLEVPPPPMAALADTGHHYPADNLDLHQPGHASLSRKRSFSPPPTALTHSQKHTLQHQPRHPCIAIHPPPSLMPEPHSVPYSPLYPRYPQNPTIQADPSPVFSGYPNASMSQHVTHPPQSSVGYRPSGSLAPHDSQPRRYSAGSIHSFAYENNGGLLSYPSDVQPPRGSITQSPFATPSPPLLTTPFYPSGSTPNTCIVEPLDPSMVVVSGMPGMPYDSDADVRNRNLR
ncbi:hypothetical protein PAXRUDRAFT_210495 [Paxillus rubicundulus Ve08.2h10]|uniref:Homeobox domain-containing protein n=1 Tax=Paxillus rubicundulus Ve08.2h10 TaxID=930991 RepID=A0A0D0CE93_9AGAM|nr:hypothetical protein PAXRUDRAFT_210495 [Paxillus rubicundulus Ve08.2h10]